MCLELLFEVSQGSACKKYWMHDSFFSCKITNPIVKSELSVVRMKRSFGSAKIIYGAVQRACFYVKNDSSQPESNEIVFSCPRGEEEQLFLHIHLKIEVSNLWVVQTSEAHAGSLVLEIC